jgi:hypothetical protein
MRYFYFLLMAVSALSSGKALAQTTPSPPEPLPDSLAYQTASVPRNGPSPVLPWWLPNAQECVGIRMEEARTAPQEARRRTRHMRRWAEEQPEPQRQP